MFRSFPFEHFASSGSFPSSSETFTPEDADTSELYETLGISKDADAKEIKKAYRKLSLIHHPDKGGDERRFREINAAYKVLSDPDKRAAYDKYGLEGASEEGRDGGSCRRERSGPRKGPSANHPLKVSLEDLYNGKTVKLAVNRKVIVGDVYECGECRGQGAVVEVRRLGLAMIQQVLRPCERCNGQGNQAEMKIERKVLEVHIDKGTEHKEKIKFRGMADEHPGRETGDINFVIQEKEHDQFKRKGADLLVIREVSLNQALCGFSWKLTHLDGRKILVTSRPGEVIKPDMNTTEHVPFVKTIANEGMPSRGNPLVRGDLYILFRVRFPDDNELNKEQIDTLRKVLPNPDTEVDRDPGEAEEPQMDCADLRHFGKGGADQRNDAYDSDDEEGVPRTVSCAQS